MKVFKIELMVIDFDDVGAEGIKGVLENARYPNRCISPQVQGMEHREVEWSDDHPLNFASTADQAFKDLFKPAGESNDDENPNTTHERTGGTNGPALGRSV